MLVIAPRSTKRSASTKSRDPYGTPKRKGTGPLNSKVLSPFFSASSGVIVILRSMGHDVLTVQEAGRRGSADPDVLTDATADGRAVLTHNHRHFKRLHARGQPHGGIVSCTRDDNDLSGLAQRIHDAVAAVPSIANQFIRVVRPNPSAKP
jgi:Domain of unknown function (DUF5615)